MLASCFLLAAVLVATPSGAAAAPDGGPGADWIGVEGDGGFVGSARPTGDGGATPASAMPAHPASCELRFSGNRVLAEEVYRAVLDLPADSCANEPTATLVRNRLETFLHRSGYELATVTTRVTPGQLIEIEIDEGRLEKIVFRGNFNLNTLRFQLGLQLPFEVFNRPELDRQIRNLTATLGLGRVWYKLVPTKDVKHIGPQVTNLGELGELQGHELVHAQEAYELHIFFTEKVWDTGAWLDLRTSNQDGFEVIGTWQGQDALLPDDRYRLSTSGGLGIRRQMYNENYYPTFSRAYGEAIYYLPVPKVRVLLEARSELVSRQRPDLGLESYYNLFADALVSAQYEFTRKQTIIFGAGGRYQDLFGETPWYSGLSQTQLISLFPSQKPAESSCGAPGSPLPPEDCLPRASLTPIRAFRPFFELRLNLLFDDGGQRWDRRSDLTVEAREFLPINEPEFGEARAAWQRVFPFGWHDLWLKASGAWLWGDVPFHNEEPVNGHLRNVFSDLYVHKVVSESSEFRFSITRDVFKFSLFNDIATFGWLKTRDLNASHDTEVIAVGDCFGAGFHALIEGIFQVDMYYSVGWATVPNRPYLGVPSPPSFPHFDNGFSLSLQKVF